MGLPEDPVEAWTQERGRGGRILGADAVEQVEGTVPELCVMDDPNSGYPLSVSFVPREPSAHLLGVVHYRRRHPIRQYPAFLLGRRRDGAQGEGRDGGCHSK